MKTLEEWAIIFYGLEKDKENNTARWRAMKSNVDIMVGFLEMVSGENSRYALFPCFCGSEKKEMLKPCFSCGKPDCHVKAS
jgi:hypothetical protein